MSTITIIGAGRIGQAFTNLLTLKHTVCLWDINSSLMPEPLTLQEAVAEAEVIFLCMPSWAVKGALQNITPLLLPDAILLSPAKGIDPENLQTIDQVFISYLSATQPWAIMIGPMMAEEMNQSGHAAAVIATQDKKTFDAIHSLFGNTVLHTEYSSDTHAVALTGVLKSVYATALGIADGLDWSISIKGWLTAKCVQEMISILKSLEKSHDHVIDTAGLADLICSGFNTTSRQRGTGEQIVKAGTPEKKAEGISSLPSLITLLKNNTTPYPVLHALEGIIIHKKPAKETMEYLLP